MRCQVTGDSFLMRPCIMAFTSSISFIMCMRSFDNTYLRLCAMVSCVSNSAADPCAIYKNCMNSFFVLRDLPSAILLGIETAARFICAVSPYTSDFGNDAEMWYIAMTKRILFCHTIKSRYDCICIVVPISTTSPLPLTTCHLFPLPPSRYLISCALRTSYFFY